MDFFLTCPLKSPIDFIQQGAASYTGRKCQSVLSKSYSNPFLTFRESSDKGNLHVSNTRGLTPKVLVFTATLPHQQALCLLHRIPGNIGGFLLAAHWQNL